MRKSLDIGQNILIFFMILLTSYLYLDSNPTIEDIKVLLVITNALLLNSLILNKNKI